jgi:HEPN domain-containing protein
MKKQVEKWLRFAELDLRAAKKLLEDPLLTQNSAFHIHQSVEKLCRFSPACPSIPAASFFAW